MSKKTISLLFVICLFLLFSKFVNAQSLAERVSGRMLLQVESGGNIWYVYPENNQRYSITFANALPIFENLALGINNTDLAKIPLHNDGWNSSIGNRLKGRLLLAVERGGEIWYVDMDGRRWSVTWDNLMSLFESLALGITNADLSQIGETRINELIKTENNTEDVVENIETFRPSIVLSEISETSGKNDQYYCDYDETRDKITIIIKKGGVYDTNNTINKFGEYFEAVEENLEIDNIGVSKFDGGSFDELDNFVENLVKEENVGYIMLVGSDLPIVSNNEDYYGYLALDHGYLNDKLAFVDREKTQENLCVDVAISTIFAIQESSDGQKNEFIKDVFDNFIAYHKNTENILNTFSNKSFIVFQGSDFASARPEFFGEYEKYFFHPPIYYDYDEKENIQNQYLSQPVMVHYSGHGGSARLALGMNDALYTRQSEFLAWSLGNDIVPGLFFDIREACLRSIIEDSVAGAASWPQVMMEAGVWNYFHITGSPYHHNFNRWFDSEKIFGKAMRKTFHNQSMIYGDILATNPY